MGMANVDDFGKVIKATAPTAREAFDAAVDYAVASRPGEAFVVEGPYPVGVFGGAIVTGYGYTLRAS